MTLLPIKPWSRKLIFLFVLLAGVAIGLGLHVHNSGPTLPPVIIMGTPFTIPAQRCSLFERVVPVKPGWYWLWKIQETLSPRTRILLNARLYEFSPTSNTVTSKLNLPPPTFASPGGVQVWLLSNSNLDVLCDVIEHNQEATLLERPRFDTADEVDCTLFVGNSLNWKGINLRHGLSVDYSPRLHAETLDLTTVIQQSELITNDLSTALPSEAIISTQTNLDIAARLQVPKGNSMFILDATPSNTNHKHLGMVVKVILPGVK